MGPRTLKRGDVVLVALGKPRPAIVVQSDDVPTPMELLLCPLSTTSPDELVYRPTVQPTLGNRLKSPSQMMTDKVGPIPFSKIGAVIGRLDDSDLLNLNVALAVILGLGG